MIPVETPPVPVVPNPTFPPDRKVWSGGLAAIVTWLIVYLFGRVGVVLDPSIQALIPALVGTLIAYLVPPAAQDIVKRVNNDIVRLANADQENPTRAIIVGEGASLLQAHADMAKGLVPPAPLPPVPDKPKGT